MFTRRRRPEITTTGDPRFPPRPPRIINGRAWLSMPNTSHPRILDLQAAIANLTHPLSDSWKSTCINEFQEYLRNVP
jgi:hypothetical protein